MSRRRRRGGSVPPDNVNSIDPIDFDVYSVSIAIAISPDADSVLQGGTVDYTVTLTRTNFAGVVALAVSGLPTGVTGEFSPSTLSGGTLVSTLTLTAAEDAPAVSLDAFTVTATGTGVSPATDTADVSVTSADGAIEAPSPTLRLTPMTQEPWYVGGTGASAFNTQYGVRTYVGAARECHLYRRPSLSGTIDYSSAVTVVSADAGISVSQSVTEVDGLTQVATARLMITGVVAGVSLLTLSCNGVQETYRVVVGTRRTRDGLVASEHADLPQLLPDWEDVPPCPTTSTFKTITTVAELTAALADFRPGDVLRLQSSTLYDFTSFALAAVLGVSRTGGAKGWRRIEWDSTAADAALGSREAMLTRAPGSIPATAPRMRANSTNWPSLFFGRSGSYCVVRGVVFEADPTNTSLESCVRVGRYYYDDPMQSAGTAEPDSASNEAVSARLFQCWFKGMATGSGDPVVTEMLYEGTVSGAATDNTTNVTIPIAAGAPTGAQVTVGMLARVRKVGNARPSPTDYPSESCPYVASTSGTYGSQWAFIYRVSAYSYNSGDTTATVTLEAHTSATPARTWSPERPLVSQIAAGAVVEFLPAPTTSAYPALPRLLHLNGARHVVYGCQFRGINASHDSNADTQMILMLYGSGGIGIVNNGFYGRPSEFINTGGSGCAAGMHMKDVSVLFNSFISSDVPRRAGGISQMKNFFEMKNGQRYVIEQNYFRGMMEGDGDQHGYGLTFKTQYYNYFGDTAATPTTVTSHVTVRFNQFDRHQGFASLNGSQAEAGHYTTQAGSHHLTLHDNILTRPLTDAINGSFGRFLNVTSSGGAVTEAMSLRYAHAFHNTIVTHGGYGVTMMWGSITLNRTYYSSAFDNVIVMGTFGADDSIVVVSSGSNGPANDDSNIAAYAAAEGASYGVKRNVILAWDDLDAGQATLATNNIRATGTAAPWSAGTDGSAGQFLGNPLTSTTLGDYDIHPNCTALRTAMSGATVRAGADIAALAVADIITTV